MGNRNHFIRRCWIFITILFSLCIFCSACSQNRGLSTEAITQEAHIEELSEEQFATLSSLKKIDDYPFYTMQYYGEYNEATSSSNIESQGTTIYPEAAKRLFARPWACSLFTTLKGSDNILFGRNFDWEYSPALLLFTKPPGGYASVSMVDLAFVGFGSFNVQSIQNRPILERKSLLKTPFIPFDGMNEKGLAIGMALVPPGFVKPDPKKPTIGQLRVMRKVLDTCSSINEAITTFRSYNIIWKRNRPLHYLIADQSGESVLVEFYNGQMVTIRNDKPWQSATNFLIASVGQYKAGTCTRYDIMNQRLSEARGHFTMQNAMDLLANVAQIRTQWSIVYGMNTGDIKVSMGRNYKNLHRFHLNIGKE